jgi:hypothetical protein
MLGDAPESCTVNLGQINPHLKKYFMSLLPTFLATLFFSIPFSLHLGFVSKFFIQASIFLQFYLRRKIIIAELHKLILINNINVGLGANLRKPNRRSRNDF